jgi:hypothetical protein
MVVTHRYRWQTGASSNGYDVGRWEGEGVSPTCLRPDLSANLAAGAKGSMNVGIGKTVTETDRDQ